LRGREAAKRPEPERAQKLGYNDTLEHFRDKRGDEIVMDPEGRKARAFEARKAATCFAISRREREELFSNRKRTARKKVKGK